MANLMRKMWTSKQVGDIAKENVSSGTKLYKHSINISGKNDEDVNVAINLVCYSANNTSISGTYASGIALLNEFFNMISIRTLAEELYDSFVSLHVSTYDEFEVLYNDRTGDHTVVFNFEDDKKATVVDVITPL